MNTDPNRQHPGGPDDEPALIGAALRPVEDRLRRSLGSEASRITPTDRLGAILADAHRVEAAPSSRPHRWYVPAAAAAAAVLLAGTVWAVSRGPEPTTPPVAGSSTSVDTGSATQPSPSGPSSVPTQTASSPTTASTAPPAGTLKGAPVYWVGQSRGGFALYREFRTVPRLADPVASAVSAMTTEKPLDPDYSTPWRPASRVEVTRSGSALTVDLSADAFANTDVGSELASLAVQQLVWTATAAAATSGSPASTVTVLVDGKAHDAWGTVRLGTPMKRAATADVQAHAWVTAPQEGDRLDAGKVTFTGYGTSFEANFLWKVTTPGGTVVKSGNATGGTGTGGFGEFRFGGVTLRTGTYVVTLSTDDPSGGAEGRGPATDTKTFTVR